MKKQDTTTFYEYIKNKICLTCLAFFLLVLSVSAETLTYRNVLNEAVNSSFDIKISKLDVDISKAELKVAKSELYPILSLQFNTERNNDLSKSNSFFFAGGTVMSPYTQFRNMLYATTSYNLFDFGVTKKKVFISDRIVSQKQIMSDLQLKDLKLKILNLYTKTLQNSEEIKIKTEILKVYEEMFKAKERLYLAGTTDKISIMDEAVNIARTQDDIEISKLELRQSLEDLSSYTQKKYDAENLEVLDFDEMNIEQNIVPVNNIVPFEMRVTEESSQIAYNPENTPEALYYDYELEKKKAELDIYKKQRYPAFKLYASYGLYGQDPNNYFSSYSDIAQRNLTVGILGNLALFDGFRNKANREKAALEMEKIQVQKEKKLREMAVEYEKTCNAYESYIKELEFKKKSLTNVKQKLDALNRMCENGLVGSHELLKTKADLLSQEYDLERNIYNISSKIKEIQILTGRDI